MEIGTSYKTGGVKNNLHSNAHNSNFKEFPVVKLLVSIVFFSHLSPQPPPMLSPFLPSSEPYDHMTVHNIENSIVYVCFVLSQTYVYEMKCVTHISFQGRLRETE